MSDVVLLVDVGNTNIKLGLAAEERGLEAVTSLPTRRSGLEGRLVPVLARKLADLARSAGRAEPPTACLISSVVPPLDQDLEQALATILGTPPLFVPRDKPVPLDNRYARPDEVGADRLLAAYGARCLAPEAERVIVVDFGTATTFDCLQGNAYLGGLICPGVLSSVRSLTEETAKLPQATLEIDPTRLHIGRSTLDSLNQGLVWGFAALVDGVIPRLEDELGGQAHILATGGLAPAIAKVSARLDEVLEDLVMEGLRRVYLAG